MFALRGFRFRRSRVRTWWGLCGSTVARFVATHLCAAALVAAPASASAGAPAARAVPAADARDAGLVADISAHLSGKPAVRARFRQIQTLAALKNPLVSTGSLLFLRERGVVWRTDAPSPALYVIGDAGVAQFDANGHRVPRGGRPAAGVAQVSRMMRALLGGDLSALYAQFDVTAGGTPARWHIELTPNQPQLAQAIRSLRMEGGAFLQTLVIRTASGDVTRIEFFDSAVVDAPPPADLALFGAL